MIDSSGASLSTASAISNFFNAPVPLAPALGRGTGGKCVGNMETKEIPDTGAVTRLVAGRTCWRFLKLPVASRSGDGTKEECNTATLHHHL